MRLEIEKRIMESCATGNIQLDNMQIKDSEINDILEAIKTKLPSTVVISLDSNSLSDEGAIILSRHLSELTKLEELSVQFNKIGSEGAISLFSLKKESPSLKILFHGNKIRNVTEMMEIERIALQSSQLAP